MLEVSALQALVEGPHFRRKPRANCLTSRRHEHESGARGARRANSVGAAIAHPDATATVY
jgi:hypothetical protein